MWIRDRPPLIYSCIKEGRTRYEIDLIATYENWLMNRDLACAKELYEHFLAGHPYNQYRKQCVDAEANYSFDKSTGFLQAFTLLTHSMQKRDACLKRDQWRFISLTGWLPSHEALPRARTLPGRAGRLQICLVCMITFTLPSAKNGRGIG